MTASGAAGTGFVVRSGLPFPADTTARLMIDAIDAGLAPGFATEVNGAAAPVLMAAVAARRPSATLGTGIVPLGSRSPATLAMEAATVAALLEGPFLLGVGVSTPQIVERWHEAAYTPTVDATRSRLLQLRTLLDGGSQGSFALTAPPGPDVRLLLGALGPRMLDLAYTVADGAIVNLTPAAALTPPPAGSDLYASVWAQACDDAEWRARREITGYALAGPYGRHLERIGYGETVARVRKLHADGRLREAPASLPDDLVDALYVGVGDLTTRLAAYRTSGVTPIVIPVIGDDPIASIGRLIDHLGRARPSGPQDGPDPTEEA